MLDIDTTLRLRSLFVFVRLNYIMLDVFILISVSSHTL